MTFFDCFVDATVKGFRSVEPYMHEPPGCMSDIMFTFTGLEFASTELFRDRIVERQGPYRFWVGFYVGSVTVDAPETWTDLMADRCDEYDFGFGCGLASSNERIAQEMYARVVEDSSDVAVNSRLLLLRSPHLSTGQMATLIRRAGTLNTLNYEVALGAVRSMAGCDDEHAMQVALRSKYKDIRDVVMGTWEMSPDMFRSFVSHEKVEVRAAAASNPYASFPFEMWDWVFSDEERVKAAVRNNDACPDEVKAILSLMD